MSNQDFPERTCLICKDKKNKKSLFRLVKTGENKYVFDEKQKQQSRGYYICKTHECLHRLTKHKRIKMNTDDLMKMLNLLKKGEKDYLNILKAMKNSQVLSFGMNMVLDEIEHTHFLVLAENISEKNEKKLLLKAKELNINFVYFGNKNQLGDIFGKDEVSVVGVKNKKIARGLIN
ncbi:DUF448 domain-containing protein [Fusobacterium sp.]|uniref:DUF448 domain-containing protein n=1 Tax=Fusobacterium sp. TaxID=68766 RepID=UPI0028FF77AB|nr:DUF448 domain-containing protein [Fusobacterium sp.]MDU1909874.1 DUF448 domain-containing protein [Fusobacterium sp.]